MRPLAALAMLGVGLSGCGGAAATGGGPGPTAPTAVAAEAEDFPADASAVHYHPIHHAAFGPLYGSGCPVNGACGCGGAKTLADEFSCQMDRLAANDIPVTGYLFDGSAWSEGHSSADNTCSGPDCCSWALGDAAVQRLARSGVRALVHFWGGCHEETQYRRVTDRLGRALLGFYLDDGSSDAEVQGVAEFMQSALPGDWENVAKAFQNREPSTSNTALSKWTNAAYVGDLSHDFAGLQEAVSRILAKARYIPAPYAEFTGYVPFDPGAPDEEVYYRRLHFGALQPVMAQTPWANADPWRAGYGPDLVRSYRHWAWLHKELVPYFYSCAYRMFESGNRPVLRRGPNTWSLRVGDEIYAPLVTEPTRAMDVQLPWGQWIDYWDESALVSGTLAGFPVPLGREPVFIRLGALVPMDVEGPQTGHGTSGSRGSLTVLAYPSGTSSFRYREDARTDWITFTSALDEDRLTLAAEPGLPGRPVLFRIGRWLEVPGSVAVDAARVTVNQGGGAPPLASEAAVNASRESAWFYDAPAHRLIVKVVP
jgi:hypothetical protein